MVKHITLKSPEHKTLPGDSQWTGDPQWTEHR